MNATTFVVLLVIGVLCANVRARVDVDESKETKLGTSMSKSATKGIGAELSVTAQTNSTSYGTGYASVTKSPKGPSAFSDGNGYTDTNGAVSARGRNANASSTSGSAARGSAAAAADRRGAAARGNGSAGSSSTARGRTTDKKKKKKKCDKDKKRCD
ncbi:PREDICTED: UPF0540 protein At1g62000-like [Camelina sativa]|uniref:UPF0540 protein At1g62000-like n=1 Tax=Camelina sativa TaxID=90675 RepID=A0ABM0SZ00_CAMSA|nr:PREDICTED: UPF0540 protein At1g62000-like [Camelina sativa]